MSDPYGSFAGAFTSGLRGAIGVIDAVDQRKERMEDRAQAKMRQARDDKYVSKLRGREDENYDYEKLLRSQSQEDRERALADDQLSREHLAKLRPYEISMARIQQSGAYTNQELSEYKLRQAKNAERRQMAAQQIAQVSTYVESGNLDAAREASKGLEDYGFDVGVMRQNGATQSIINTTTQVLNGEIDISGPVASEALSVILKPALNLSGRDTEKFDFARLEETEKGTYKVWMRDKENDREVPATLLASDKNHDLLIELTPQQLVQSIREFTELASVQESLHQQKIMTELKATGQGVGLDYAPSADLVKMQAEKVAEEKKQTADRFVESFDPLDQGIATALVNRPGFNAQSDGQMVSQVRRLMEKNDDMTPLDAIARIQNDEQIQSRVDYDATNWVQLYPGLTMEKAQRLAELRIRDPGKADFVRAELEKHKSQQASKLRRQVKDIDRKNASLLRSAEEGVPSAEDVVPLRMGR